MSRVIEMRGSVVLDGGEPVACEVRRDQEFITYQTSMAVKPDMSWRYVDKARHIHRWVKTLAGEKELKMLISSRRHVACDGRCGDRGCEGYEITVWHCRSCGEEIEPGYVSDNGPRSMPGTVTWMITALAAPLPVSRLIQEVSVGLPENRHRALLCLGPQGTPLVPGVAWLSDCEFSIDSNGSLLDQTWELEFRPDSYELADQLFGL
jgi:ribosomal protein L37AE/L43A